MGKYSIEELKEAAIQSADWWDDGAIGFSKASDSGKYEIQLSEDKFFELFGGDEYKSRIFLYRDFGLEYSFLNYKLRLGNFLFFAIAVQKTIDAYRHENS